MPIFDCRGESTRRALVENYDINPLTHVRLFEDQTKESCAGPELSREYYIFTYVNRQDVSDEGTFVCGITVANDFIKLIQETNPSVNRLPLFDPITNLNEAENIEADLHINNIGRDVQQTVNWHPIAKELYIAISMICLIWNLDNITGALASVLSSLVANPSHIPSMSDIRSINTIILKNFTVGNSAEPSLAIFFQNFLLRKNIANPKLIQFPHLTRYFEESVASEWHPKSYFN